MAEFSDKDTKEESGYRLPEQTTLYHAAKIAIVEDKPIMMDYWTHSIDKTVSIGVKENNEKLLVKSDDEYTSPIIKIFKIGQEYIIQTENSKPMVATKNPEIKDKPRFGIGSLINRMAGTGPAAPIQNETLRSDQDSQRNNYNAEHNDTDANKEKIEVPAFLRRQAN